MAIQDLSFFDRGNISGNVKKEISQILTDCYKRFGEKAPYKIAVYVFDTDVSLNNFLRDERFKLGLVFNPIDESSACTYAVLRGHPILLISADKLNCYSKAGRAGALRHEAAHTVLHGDLEHSIYQIPEDCRHTAMIKSLEPERLDDAFMQLIAGIRDFQATKLLIECGYIQCQFDYALEWIQITAEDKTTWDIVKSNRQTRFSYESALMRPLLFSDPLLSLSKSGDISNQEQSELCSRLDQIMAFLGETEENKVLKVAGAIVDVITQDTTGNNFNSAFRELMTLL